MDKKTEQFIRFIKKYISEIIILIGVWILVYYSLEVINPPIGGGSGKLSWENHSHYNEEITYGAIIFVIGIIATIRKYLYHKKDK